MANKKEMSFNGQVFEKAYKRLNLSPTQRVIFQRLLGFLIRNDKPFPFSAVKMAELTGFSLRTIFNVLNELETYRLIKRHGLGKNRKFSAGTILNKIFTTVQNRKNKAQNKNKTTVQPMQQNSNNRATGAYIKTLRSLKRNNICNNKNNYPNPEYVIYSSRIKGAIQLNLLTKDTLILTEEEWMAQKINNHGLALIT